MPQSAPHASVHAMLLLQPAAHGLGSEDQVVADAQPLQVGEQVEQEVHRDSTERRVLVHATVVTGIAVAHTQEDELISWRACRQSRLQYARLLEVATR